MAWLVTVGSVPEKLLVMDGDEAVVCVCERVVEMDDEGTVVCVSERVAVMDGGKVVEESNATSLPPLLADKDGDIVEVTEPVVPELEDRLSADVVPLVTGASVVLVAPLPPITNPHIL